MNKKIDALFAADNGGFVRLSELKKDPDIRKALSIKSNASIAQIAEAVEKNFSGLYEVKKIGRLAVMYRVEQETPVNQIAEPAQDTIDHTQRKVIRAIKALTHNTAEKSVSVPTLYKALGWKGKKYDVVLSKMAALDLIALEYTPLDGALIESCNGCISRYRDYRIRINAT